MRITPDTFHISCFANLLTFTNTDRISKSHRSFIQICQLQVTVPTDGQFTQHMKGSEDALWHPHTTEWPAGKWSLLVRTQSASESSQHVLYLSKPLSSVKSHRSYVVLTVRMQKQCLSAAPLLATLTEKVLNTDIHTVHTYACVYARTHKPQAL